MVLLFPYAGLSCQHWQLSLRKTRISFLSGIWTEMFLKIAIMHSSRMRTARRLTVSWGGGLPCPTKQTPQDTDPSPPDQETDPPPRSRSLLPWGRSPRRQTPCQEVDPQEANPWTCDQWCMLGRGRTYPVNKMTDSCKTLSSSNFVCGW